MITNYERVRDGDIDPSYFAAVSLDEASVLRSFGSKVYQTFIDKFKGVKYKIVATATPSPNRYKELIHYAGFLEIMDTGQALTRFFKRDSTKANNLTLLPAQEDEFWMWMSSWAIFVTKPSDIDPQYSDAGYDLPGMDIRWHKLKIEHGDIVGKNGEYQLYQDAAGSLQDAAQLKRESLQQRIAKAKMIIDADPNANFVIWHDLEDERKTLKKPSRKQWISTDQWTSTPERNGSLTSQKVEQEYSQQRNLCPDPDVISRSTVTVLYFWG